MQGIKWAHRAGLQLRLFSHSTLGKFSWKHGSAVWDVPCTVIEPSEGEEVKGSFMLFPSVSLFGSREEWRECAQYLADVGYRSVSTDWPGWFQRSTPINWAIEDGLKSTENISLTMMEFSSSFLQHCSQAYGSRPMFVAASGGASTIYALRAIKHLNELNPLHPLTISQLISFAPVWRMYLPSCVPEGYPKKLARRQAMCSWFLSTFFVRSRTAYNIYKSKYAISRISKRLYEDKIQGDPDLMDSKREIVMRDRPLQLDAAMMVGLFYPIHSSQSFINEIIGQHTEEQLNDDSDDDDTLLNIKVPQWAKSAEVVDPVTLADTSTGDNRYNIPITFVIPDDVLVDDKADLRLLQEWTANDPEIKLRHIPGRLFCHEESPALSAKILLDSVQCVPV